MATAPVMDDAEAVPANDAGSLSLLVQIAQSEGDISGLFDDAELGRIGIQVVEDYDRDCRARDKWEVTVTKALKRAAQEHDEPDANRPAYRRSHIDYPLLTIAAQQFNARAYPAICRPDGMVKVKVIGNDRGRPQMGPDGQPLVMLNGQPMTLADATVAVNAASQQQGPDGQAIAPPQPQPMWAIPPGAKQERADRVGDYLSTYIQYRMDDWEADTDLLLMQIPVVGCGFRKLWWEDGVQRAAFVSALDLVVPMTAKSLETAPRMTERMNDVYPYQIRERQNAGQYRVVDLAQTDDDDEEAPRLLLEQHRLLDLDGDGVDEPYVITVDKETREVLRLEPGFGVDDVMFDGERVVRIKRPLFYIMYPFLPDPKGGFYGIGFGHLIEQIGDVVNASINQMMDAGTAAIAGGGFIAGGLRLQSNNRTETMRWMPGEYKVVNAAAADLRAGIVERTFPTVSPITFQILEMMLGAAKEVTSVKDITTGDAPNTAPVGTTLALIEQGLQVFTAIYKRIYRALGCEYQRIYVNLGQHGDEQTAEDYMNVLDDPQADFTKDFSEQDTDIKPVADPTAVTSQQKLAKAQVVLQVAAGDPNFDQWKVKSRVLEAAGIDNVDDLRAEGSGPSPMDVADLAVKQSQANKNNAQAQQAGAAAVKTGVDVGHKLGAGDAGGVPGVAVPSGDGMGGAGLSNDGGGTSGGMGAGVVEGGGV